MEKIKLTEEIKNKFLQAIEEKGFKELIEKTKMTSDEDTGTFEVIITTEDVDRYGEVINLGGWDLTNYMKNPVVLWGHDHYKMPVGICTSIERTEKGLLAKGKFAPSEDGQEIRSLYDMGIIRATSVGFIEIERMGNIITKAELLEFSFVSVPANPMCLSTIVKSSLSINSLITKGFLNVEVKEAEEEKKKEEIEGEKEEEKVEENEGEEKKEEEKIEEDEKGFTKISKSKLKSVKLALKEASDVFESLEESDEEEEDLEDIEKNDDDNKDEENLTDEEREEKEFKDFQKGRKLTQQVVTVLAEYLADMRKTAESKGK